jgi:hypothetical protein
VGLAGTLEAGRGIPRSEYMRRRLMSESGQERRIGAIRNISALPPRADVGADIVERPVSAMSGNGGP